MRDSKAYWQSDEPTSVREAETFSVVSEYFVDTCDLAVEGRVVANAPYRWPVGKPNVGFWKALRVS